VKKTALTKMTRASAATGDPLAFHRHPTVQQSQDAGMYVLSIHYLASSAHSHSAIPNLHAVHTLTSLKTATTLDKSMPAERSTPLNVLLQVNTSGEDSKSGLPPLRRRTTAGSSEAADSPLVALAVHIVTRCPRLHLQGLMTIGALTESLASEEENRDFERLKETRDVLQEILGEERGDAGTWGEQPDRRLLLSMGMSNDFEVAIEAGSDIVRVGSRIFGERPKKADVQAAQGTP
jgi:pyridoxal phosphate enzyme (YggS family)